MNNMIKAMTLTTMITVMLVMFGCAGKGVKEIDSALTITQLANNGSTIGVTSDKLVVLQKQTMANDELNRLEWQNNQSEWSLHREVSQLKDCRSDLADKRLGGNGEVTALPAVDNMKPETQVKEEFGLVNGSLQFIKREDFVKRIEAERSYQTSLEKMLTNVRDSREDCERKMGVARRTAGLPSQRIQGISTVTAEGKIDKVIRKNEP